MSAHGEPVELLTPEQVGERTRAVKRMDCSSRFGVSTRYASTRERSWPACRSGSPVASASISEFDRTITAVAMPAVDRRQSRAGRPTELWICSGDELNLLFADQFDECGLVRCKLQMMRSEPYGARWRIGPMLAGRADAPPLRLVPELPEPAGASPPGRRGNTVARSSGDSCAGVSKRPWRIDHRRLA